MCYSHKIINEKYVLYAYFSSYTEDANVSLDRNLCATIEKLVGAVGFEPTTPAV